MGAKVAFPENGESQDETSADSYRVLLDTISDGVEEIDLSGNILVANPAMHDIYGVPQGELVGMNISVFVPTEEERSALMDYVGILIKEQPDPVPYFGRKQTPDGDIVDVRVNWNYKRNNRGELTGFVSVISDITEAKGAENSLR